MASRADISVLWHLSPRVIVVAAPSVELTIQDLHDTLRDLEDEPANLIYPKLIDTAGGEELGGSVTVGLTSTLRNAVVSFEARATKYSNGLAEAGSSEIRLVDTTADFVAAGVLRGDLIENNTDESYASVLNVVDANTLDITNLTGGTTNIFAAGEDYHLWHVYQCNISGGNLVAVDEVGSEISSVLPTFGTQIVRTSASSATAIGLDQLEISSFGGMVAINVNSAFSGTDFPNGTLEYPVNNLADAHTISMVRGLNTFLIQASMTLGVEDLSMGHVFTGLNAAKVLVTIDAGANVTNCEFRDLSIQGVLDGNNVLRQCNLLDVTYIQGFIFQVALSGTITLGAGVQASIFDCFSNVAGGLPGQTATIDCAGSGHLALRNYSGGLSVANVTGGGAISMDFSSGRCIFNNTCTGGSAYVRGVCDVTDNSAGTMVYDQTISRQVQIVKANTNLIPGLM